MFYSKNAYDEGCNRGCFHRQKEQRTGRASHVETRVLRSPRHSKRAYHSREAALWCGTARPFPRNKTRHEGFGGVLVRFSSLVSLVPLVDEVARLRRTSMAMSIVKQEDLNRQMIQMACNNGRRRCAHHACQPGRSGYDMHHETT